jgi:hypothetical protein
MLVGRKKKKPTKVVKDQITDVVTRPQLEEEVQTEEILMEEPKEEMAVEDQITDVVTRLQLEEEVQTEEILIEQPKEDKRVFMMDISEFGVKGDEAEKFVKTAIRFYFENKDKKMVDESKLKEIEESLSSINDQKSDDRYFKVLERIKKFEDQIKNNQFVPKKTVLDFLKDLK